MKPVQNYGEPLILVSWTCLFVLEDALEPILSFVNDVVGLEMCGHAGWTFTHEVSLDVMMPAMGTRQSVITATQSGMEKQIHLNLWNIVINERWYVVVGTLQIRAALTRAWHWDHSQQSSDLCSLGPSPVSCAKADVPILSLACLCKRAWVDKLQQIRNFVT